MRSMFDGITDGIKKWMIGRFVSAIKHTSRSEDRALAIQWLSDSRDVVASDLRSIEKFKKLNALINSRTAIVAIAKSVSEAVSNYRKSDLPWSMKVALPATLAAIPLVGGHAAGIAAFGGALGVPVLLLIFLGTAGITSIIEAIVTSPEARPHIAEIIDIIIQDERLRRTSAQMKAAMKEQPMDPTRFAVPMDEVVLRKYLLGMDPFHFERHTMSFFDAAGFEAWVTRKSNDFGVDGFAIPSRRFDDHTVQAQFDRQQGWSTYHPAI
jgi:restriction system protein